jgi:GNAT superfamily N-acetyltransferase
MTIKIALTNEEILACYPVMKELRPHISETQFLERVLTQQESGYQLSYLTTEDGVAAVTGFRIGENLAWGRFLYVDDLVTLPTQRSQGHGTKLLAWLKEYAVSHKCKQLHLDSGMQRLDAHRFYEREGVEKTSFHFAVTL